MKSSNAATRSASGADVDGTHKPRPSPGRRFSCAARYRLRIDDSIVPKIQRYHTLKKKSPTELALRKLEKKEYNLLEKKILRNAPLLHRLLSDKLPPKLQDTLRGAFVQAFSAVFSHGNAVIDKTFSAEKLKKTYDIHRYIAELEPTRKHLRAFAKESGKITRGNTALSGAVGGTMGLFGIGLPDIPVFVGFLLKNVYETAIANGFGYQTPGEQYFILLLIESALSSGDAAAERETMVNAWIEAHRKIPAATQRQQVFDDQMRRTAHALADAVLYMKFIQGIPIIGAAGGISDAVCVSQIGTYAAYKYERRRLMTPKNESEDHV